MIGIIGAVTTETDMIKSMTVAEEESIYAGIRFTSGNIYGRNVVIATCGVGKVNAAVCTQLMITHFSPDGIINVGSGGALTPSLRISDVVIADRLVQHDFDTTAFGDPAGFISGIDMTFFPTDAALSRALEAAAGRSGVNTQTGTVASGDIFVSDIGGKIAINEKFGAAVCEMEGAAVAQVCCINKVPFTVMRAVSDELNDSGELDYEKFCVEAAVRTQQILASFFRSCADTEL